MLQLYDNFDFAEHCRCRDFEARHQHHWVRNRFGEDFFENVDQGDFPDWLEIEESDSIHEALCVARPQMYQSPKKYCFCYDEVDEEVDEYGWVSPDSVVPVKELPFKSLLPMMNTLRLPHSGMESVPFWLKIYARFWTSYGFYMVKVCKGSEYQRFRQIVLDPSNVWMLPYWCLRMQKTVLPIFDEDAKCYRTNYDFHRYMLLVVRDTEKLENVWGRIGQSMKSRITNAFDFLSAIATVSVPYNKDFLRIRHIANPMIPHALQWMCVMMPDCYEQYLLRGMNKAYFIQKNGISICHLKVEGEEIDVSHPVLRKYMPTKLTSIGRPFLFHKDNKCYLVVEGSEERVTDEPDQRY